jgi:translation elongation factor P/translation initiation factor 5A
MESHKKHKKNIHFLDQEDYEIIPIPPEDLDLKDNVILVKIINNSLLIPFKTALQNSIINLSYGNDNFTFAMCPFSLYMCLIQDTYMPTEFIENNILVVTNGKENVALQDIENKKNVELLTLEQAISNNLDCQYLVTKKDKEYILDKKYYENKKDFKNKELDLDIRLHPKTVAYLIYYKNKNTNKVSMIVGKDANIKTSLGYNTIKSGIKKYFEIYSNKILENTIFVTPILLFVGHELKDKVVYL